MVRKIKNSKSPEERRAEAEALQASFAAQVEALRTSETWAQFLDFVGSFHHYSLNNLLLIMAQRPEATHVAGYRTWQKLNRQVRKGERGIRIFGGATSSPPTRTSRPAGRPSTAAAGSSGSPCSTSPRPSPSTPTPRTPASSPAGSPAPTSSASCTRSATTSASRAGPFTARTSPARPTATPPSTAAAASWSTPTCPRPGRQDRPVRTAHVLLHAEQDRAEYVQHRGIAETEAESVAYVTAGLLGLDTSAYSLGYVASWSHGSADLIKDTAARVLRAVHTLTDAITETTGAAAA